MIVDTVLHNKKIFFNGTLVKGGLAIDGGKIVKIAKEANLPNATTKIDLENHITLPGLIDCHVHLRDQDLSYKEDFFSGTAAAAAGGVTTLIDMPNNRPVTMDSLSFLVSVVTFPLMTNPAFPVSYNPFRFSETICPPVGKSGPWIISISFSTVIFGLLITAIMPSHISLRL